MITERIKQIVKERNLRFELVYEVSNDTWHALLKERKLNESMYAGFSSDPEKAIASLIRIVDGLPQALREQYGIHTT